ncbi:MAG: inositol monophosphatase [Alphaproteobacteria bacterium]|nr:inositol monophosphatase [Alphaproteobacteria bacterium]
MAELRGKMSPMERRRASLERAETREQQRISSLSAILNVMVKAVRKAGRSMLRDFGEISQLQVREKGAGDFVSEADTNVEKILIESLQEDRPDYGLLSEECGEIPAKNGSPFTWIIDPIDGTTNFIHAFPYFAISIALKYHDEITAAVLFNPITNELYYAEKGQGFFMMTTTGNKRLRVSGRNDLSTSLVGLNNKENQIEKTLDQKVCSFRHLGSCTLELAAVGAGQLDAVILTKKPCIWDIAAACLFIKEAGGRMATLSGKTDLKNLSEADMVIATNLSLFPKFQKVFK